MKYGAICDWLRVSAYTVSIFGMRRSEIVVSVNRLGSIPVNALSIWRKLLAQVTCATEPLFNYPAIPILQAPERNVKLPTWRSTFGFMAP